MDAIERKNFDALLKFRVPGPLKERLERLAAVRVKTLAEVCREACVEYAERKEPAKVTETEAA